MNDENEVKYCYLVNHPTKGYKVFYSGNYYKNESARLAIDYAGNQVPVLKLILIESESDLETQVTPSLSAQFNAVVKPLVKLPELSVEALLTSVG